MRDEIGTISRQAVYDALGTLTEKGLIRRIQPARSPARYEDRVDDNHHHLVCRTCGRTVDIDCAVGYRPCLEADADHGFTIDEAEVIYWGSCPACQEAAVAAEHLTSRTISQTSTARSTMSNDETGAIVTTDEAGCARGHVSRVGPLAQRDGFDGQPALVARAAEPAGARTRTRR